MWVGVQASQEKSLATRIPGREFRCTINFAQYFVRRYPSMAIYLARLGRKIVYFHYTIMVDELCRCNQYPAAGNKPTCAEGCRGHQERGRHKWRHAISERGDMKRLLISTVAAGALLGAGSAHAACGDI